MTDQNSFPLPPFQCSEPGFAYLASWASAVDFECAREDNEARDMSLVDYAAPSSHVPAVALAFTPEWLEALKARALVDSMYMDDEEDDTADLFPTPLVWTHDEWTVNEGEFGPAARLVLAYGETSPDAGPELVLVVERRKLEG